jgi:UDP-N-acetylglucosamine:LPS N-acetylglucosamine transferase
MTRKSRCDILAVSSPGGHWIELTRLFPAFEGRSVEYATADSGRAVDVPAGRLNVVSDANQRTPWRLLVCTWQILRLVMALRPQVIVSTGAAPGLIAIGLGKAIGAHTVWVDTVAAVDFADVYLVQWPHLARTDGPRFEGSVL